MKGGWKVQKGCFTAVSSILVKVAIGRIRITGKIMIFTAGADAAIVLSFFAMKWSTKISLGMHYGPE